MDSTFITEFQHLLPIGILPVHLYAALSVLLLLVVMGSVRRHGKLKEQNRRLAELSEEFIRMQHIFITTLGEVIERRSQETSSHVKRVALISAFLAEKSGLSEDEVIRIETASPLHDIGKIAIPDRILNKTTKLTDKEFKRIMEHTVTGKELLSANNHPLLKTAEDIAYCHHERWDGKGYPRGISGEAIPLSARITMVADVYDALLSDRCYKKAWKIERILTYFEKEKGKQFDPRLADILLANHGEVKRRYDLADDEDTSLLSMVTLKPRRE